MVSTFFATLILYFILCFIISHFLSEWKNFDFYNCLFLCLAFTPIIATIILILNNAPSYSKASGFYIPNIRINKTKIKFKKIFSLRFIALIVFLICILIITNPTKKRFVDFIGSARAGDYNIRRTSNYMVASVYCLCNSSGEVEETYIGIFLNFYAL